MAAFFPRHIVTPEDTSPIVSVVTWVLLVATILGVSSKVALRGLTSRTFNIDDMALVAAMVMY